MKKGRVLGGIKEDIVDEWTMQIQARRTRDAKSSLTRSYKIYSISLHQNKYVCIQILMATQQHPS